MQRRSTSSTLGSGVASDERYVRWPIQPQLLPRLVRFKKQITEEMQAFEDALSMFKNLVGRVIAFHGTVPMAASKVKPTPFRV